MKAQRLYPGLLVFCWLACAAQTTTNSHVKVTKTAQPQKRLDWQVQVNAPIDQVWQCFATREGMITWISPDAEVQLQPGGAWLAKFPGAPAGGGTIVSFEPQVQLTVHAMAPPWFPNVRKEGTTAVFTFTPIDDGHTIVRLAQVGWKSGGEWDKAYDFLAEGNATLLAQLQQRFVKGPVDWEKVMSRDRSEHEKR